MVSPEEPEGTGLLLSPNDNPIGKTYQEALYKAELPAMVFAVSDIQKEYDKLVKLGVKFAGAPTKTEWGTQALFDDTWAT